MINFIFFSNFDQTICLSHTSFTNFVTFSIKLEHHKVGSSGIIKVEQNKINIHAAHCYTINIKCQAELLYSRSFKAKQI